MRLPILTSILLLVAGESIVAQARTDSLGAAEAFVNEFYAWYAPLTDTGHTRGSTVALRLRRHQLSDALVAAIGAADDLESATREEVFGSDYFLWSQDACHDYHVTSVARHGARFRARLKCVEPNPYQDGVFVEVAAIASTWRITNIINADGKHDLIAALTSEVADIRKSLARARPPTGDSIRSIRSASPATLDSIGRGAAATEHYAVAYCALSRLDALEPMRIGVAYHLAVAAMETGRFAESTRYFA